MNEDEVRRGLEIENLENDYYAVPETKALHLRLLLKQLQRITQNVDDEDPNLQHGIDVCTDLISRFGCS